MIKIITKCVFAAALVAGAMTVSTSPSFAAKKGAKAAPVAACKVPSSVRTCTNGLCNVSWCGVDGKFYPTPIFCIEPFCISPKA